MEAGLVSRQRNMFNAFVVMDSGGSQFEIYTCADFDFFASKTT